MDQQLPDDELDAIAAQGGGQNAPVPAPISAPQPPAPAMPVAAPPQAAPALVPPGTTAVKGSRAVETPTPTPEMRQGLQDEQKVIADQRKLAGDEAATEGEKARIEQDRAEKLSEETDRQNAQILADQQAKRDLAEKINNDRLAAIDRLQQTAPPGGFEDWHGEKKVRGYLAIALGGLARGNSGGVNTALQQIEKQVEDQRKAYTADLEKQYKVLELKHGVDQDMLQSATESVADGYIRKAMALDSLNKQADAQLKALGIPVAVQAGIKAQLGFDKQAADAMQKYGMIKQTDTTQFVPGGRTGGAGPRDALSQLHDFARRHTGPEQEAQVVAEAERLFPALAGKPEKLQTLVAGAVKASADARAAAGSSVPTNFESNGQHYVVDPSKTTVRGITAARTQLGLIEGALKNGEDVLALLPKGAPQNSVKAYFTGDTARATGNSQIASLRNAAAAALKESMGVEAGKERAAAIFPDLPLTDAGMPQWRAKVKVGLDTIRALKQGALDAGGARPGKPGETGKPDGKKSDPMDAAADVFESQFKL